MTGCGRPRGEGAAPDAAPARGGGGGAGGAPEGGARHAVTACMTVACGVPEACRTTHHPGARPHARRRAASFRCLKKDRPQSCAIPTYGDRLSQHVARRWVMLALVFQIRAAALLQEPGSSPDSQSSGDAWMVDLRFHPSHLCSTFLRSR